MKPTNRNETLAKACSPATSSPYISRRRTAYQSNSPETDISAPRSTPAGSISSESTSASELSCLQPPALFSSPRTELVRKTSDVDDHQLIQVESRQCASGLPSTTSTSDASAGFRQRRTNAIVQGRLVPVPLPPGSCVSYNTALSVSRIRLTNAIIAVGARPLLHTAQGFPFDMRQSQVEAVRTCTIPSRNNVSARQQ